METERQIVQAALTALPRWNVVHWGTEQTSTLLCLWVAGHETLVPIDAGHATYSRVRQPIGGGQLQDLLRRIQDEQDRAALGSRVAIEVRDWLVTQWEFVGETDVGTWEFPGDGFVRWLHDARLLVEVGDGGDSDLPMPAPLVEVLVDLGWNPPEGRVRGCWLQPTPQTLRAAAERAVLTPMAAFGCQAPPPID